MKKAKRHQHLLSRVLVSFLGQKMEWLKMVLKWIVDFLAAQLIEKAVNFGRRIARTEFPIWRSFAPYEVVDVITSWEIQQEGDRQTTILKKQGVLRWRTSDNLVLWEFAGGDLSGPRKRDCTFQPGRIIAVERADNKNVILVLLDKVYNKGDDDLRYSFEARFRDTKFLKDAQDYLTTRVRYPTRRLNYRVIFPPEAQMTLERVRMLKDYGGSIEVVPKTTLDFCPTTAGGVEVSRNFEKPRIGSIIRLEWSNPSAA